MFYDLRTARMRFNNSVVMYDGFPVIIEEVYHDEDSSGFLMCYRPLMGAMPRDKANHTDPRWDYKAPRLGYVNAANRATYLTRMPQRYFKQGVEIGSLMYIGEGTREVLRDYNALHLMFTNTYPSFEEAIANSTDGTVAFSRELAVKNGSLLYYRGSCIGEIKNGKALVSKEHFFLKDMLEEAGVS